MPFPTIEELVQRFRQLGANQILCKPLSENDNSKQQIYLGKSMQALSVLPYGEVTTSTGVKEPTFKAALRFKWIDSDGHVADASGAQLILYPRYPEVRLSGFLRGCKIAPTEHLRPIPRGRRRFNNESDGRVLFLATTADGVVLAYLAVAGSDVARDFERRLQSNSLEPLGVFWQLPVLSAHAGRVALIARLGDIHRAGWHRSKRMLSDGSICEYTARNGGGYTLEALFEIRPNARAAPDFMGWELKAVAKSRVTLMTPEPDAGYYAVRGAEYFVREYGRSIGHGSYYFTGTHSVGSACRGTGLQLRLIGFDVATRTITQLDGGIELFDPTQRHAVMARWSYSRLISHWGSKHASAAYVPYKSRAAGTAYEYYYLSPVQLGEQTDFSRFLASLADGRVIFDPGSKLTSTNGGFRVKARSQFRISRKHLSALYQTFESVSV